MTLPIALRWQDNLADQLALQAKKLAPSPAVQPAHFGRDGTAEFLRPSSPEILFRQSYRSIVQSLALAVGDLAAAEDATQEAFIELCVRWNRISLYDNPTTWVRRVAINKLRKVHRSNARRAVALLRLVSDESMAPPPAEPDTSMLAALSALPARQRLATVLYYVEDLTMAEVASAMGISQGAVSQHLNRARSTFRAHLESSDDNR
jgi:RNA polymerase sigma-70 factor (ECF subfamily)